MKIAIDNLTIIEDYSIPLSIMGRITRKKIKMEVEDLNNTNNHPDLTDIYTMFHPSQKDIHFSQVHIKHSRINYTLGHK